MRKDEGVAVDTFNIPFSTGVKRVVLLCIIYCCLSYTHNALAQLPKATSDTIREAVEHGNAAAERADQASEKATRSASGANDAAKAANDAARAANDAAKAASDAATAAKESRSNADNAANSTKHQGELTSEIGKRVDGTLSSFRWLFALSFGIFGSVLWMFRTSDRQKIDDLIEKRWSRFVEKTLEPKLLETAEVINSAADDAITTQTETSANLLQQSIENTEDLNPQEKNLAFAKSRVVVYSGCLKHKDLVPNATEQLGAMGVLAVPALPFLEDALEFWKNDPAIQEMIREAIAEIETAMKNA